MRRSRGESWTQGYNAPAVVDADSPELVVASGVQTSPSDAHQPSHAYQAARENEYTPTRMLAVSSYASAEAFAQLEGEIDLHVAVSATDAGERRYDFRPQRVRLRGKTPNNPRLVAMGLRQFLVRGREKVSHKWKLVCTVYNLERPWALGGG